MTYEKAKLVCEKVKEIEDLNDILSKFDKCKLCLRHNNGGIAHTFDESIKDVVREHFISLLKEKQSELESL